MARFSFSKKVAFRYLWSRRAEAFISIITVISIIGVALGVMVLNIVMAVMTGFEHELREKIVGANSHIVVKTIGGRLQGWPEVAERVRGVTGVEAVSPFTYNQALIRTRSSSAGIIIRGIPPESPGAAQLASYLDSPERINDLFTPPPVTVTRDDGEEEEVALPGIMVGRELAQSMALFAGAPVSLLSSSVGSTPFGLMPRYRRFVVAGSYRSGLVEYESGLAYVDIAAAQRFFQLGDAVSGLEVRVRKVEESPRIAERVREALGGVQGGYLVQDWTETNRPLWEAIRLEKKVYFIVLLLIIVMASFSIISTLVMIVLEKRRDIAVLKTMGATSTSIANIFRWQGSVIGLIGTGAGLLLGWVGCVLLQTYGFPIDERIFQMSTLPIRMEPINFVLVGISAFLICALATIYPARRAAALDPSEVLRYD